MSRVIPDWRSAIDALRPHLQDFWRGLPARDRTRFLRHVRSYWEVARHRVAPEVGALLDDLRASGQLDVRAGRLVRAGLRTDGAQVLVRKRGSERIGVERFDYVIRATGLDTDVAQTTHPLASHLHEAGLINADAHGLGVKVNDSLEVLDGRGAPIAGLYCLGPLLRGHLWEITAIPELRAAAKKLSQQLNPVESNETTAQGRRHSLERELALSQSF